MEAISTRLTAPTANGAASDRERRRSVFLVHHLATLAAEGPEAPGDDQGDGDDRDDDRARSR